MLTFPQKLLLGSIAAGFLLVSEIGNSLFAGCLWLLMNLSFLAASSMTVYTVAAYLSGAPVPSRVALHGPEYERQKHEDRKHWLSVWAELRTVSGVVRNWKLVIYALGVPTAFVVALIIAEPYPEKWMFFVFAIPFAMLIAAFWPIGLIASVLLAP